MRQLIELIPTFMKTFLHGDVYKWNRQQGKLLAGQWKNIGVWANSVRRTINEKDLLLHFSQKPEHRVGASYGAFSVCGRFIDDMIKWVCVDADNREEFEAIFFNLIPTLKAYEIEFIIEYSRENRCHLWIPCVSKWDFANQFMIQLLEEAGCGSKKDCVFDEVFPLHAGKQHRDNNTIRIPGGFHMKTNKVNPCEYKSESSDNVLDIIRFFIEAKPLTQEKMVSLLKTAPIDKVMSLIEANKNWKDFYYTALDLPLPTDNLPFVIKKIASQCNAVRGVLDEIFNERLLNLRRGRAHDAGLYTAWMAKYASDHSGTSDGEQWFDEVLKDKRTRPADSHNFLYYKDRPGTVVSCETWSQFGYCDGCPFKNINGFGNPSRLYTGNPIQKIKTGEVKYYTPDEIKDTSFKEAGKRIQELVDTGQREDILIAAPLGLGKSTWSDEIAADLANQGKNVLIAVPTAALALEHKERLEKLGITPFILMSHHNMFSHQDPVKPRKGLMEFDCPSYDDIQVLYKMGITSSHLKTKYCKKCPLYDKCAYPTQYSEISEPEYKVVIIQHAHFKLKDIVQSRILSKIFAVMFVDESFIDSLILQVKPTESEYLKLIQSPLEWAVTLGKWLKDGGYPQTKINPSPTDIECLWYEFQEAGIVDWKIPEYVRLFNEGKYLSPYGGIKIFYELPEVPIRVFTDATPPVEMLQLVLNNENIRIFGKDQLISPKYYHPDNEVIQIINGTMSKTSMKDGRFEKIMTFIITEIDEKFPTEKILITTYQNEFASRAKEFFLNHAPELLDRVLISHMQVGVNTFHDFDVQFLLAGFYHNGLTMATETYELKSIANYWRKKADLKLIHNPYPVGAKETDRWLTNEKPVRKIELDGVYEYPQITTRVPRTFFNNLVYEGAISHTQQSLRLRFKMGEKRTIYIFGNYSFPSFPITQVRIEEELIQL